MKTTIDQIMRLCGDMPNALAHRHYLEQLPPRQLQQRLEDLDASEKKHAGRWYGGRDSFGCGVTAPETADIVSRTGVGRATRRDDGEIPIPQDSRERTAHPALNKITT